MPLSSAIEFAEAIGLRFEPRRRARVVALVGAGGKTSALYALAAAAADAGSRVVATTTTHLRDPRLEAGRRYDRLVFAPELGDSPRLETPSFRMPEPAAGEILLLASALLAEEGKLAGLHPGWISALTDHCDLVLVEADGARGKPIKAPTAHEPAMPACADLVVGVVGLDCLGKPLGPETAHRPELLGPLVGCPPGGLLGPAHLAALAASPQGLFKAAPEAAELVVLLNKADQVRAAELDALESLLAEAFGEPMVQGSEASSEPGRRIPRRSPRIVSAILGGRVEGGAA